MRKILPFVFVFIGFSLSAQLPKKALKLIGKWEFSNGSGFESWYKEEDFLIGETYKIINGDTVKVDDLIIEYEEEILIHEIKVRYENENNLQKLHYQAPNPKKLYFINTRSDISNSISYSFGFLNRNKLIIKMKFGPNGDKTKLILHRIKG